MSLNRLTIPFVPAEEPVNLSNLGDLARAPHARPHGEEARAARRLERWQQVRTRGHPSRRPRFARAPQDEVGAVKDSQARKRGRTDKESAIHTPQSPTVAKAG